MTLNVLNITAWESPGRRFHGLSLRDKFKALGIVSTHLVNEKDTEDPNVLTIESRQRDFINAMVKRVEDRMSLQNVFFRDMQAIVSMDAFKNADVVHLHLIHTGYLSLLDLPMVTAIKPTVWTLHDPWAMTGHCNYPVDCNRWQIGCGSCADLKIHPPMREDKTALMFGLKSNAYKNSRFDVVVASKWMRSMAERSPLMREKNIHEIPFGIDLELFHPAHRTQARKNLGIADDQIVISFRGGDNKFKGTSFIYEVLNQLPTQNITIIAIQGKKTADRLSKDMKLIELPWTNDEIVLRDALAASDIFLMPSIAEAFGVMAIEAMACGVPVICFDGTSLPDVIGAPDIGISVPRDTGALLSAMKDLIVNRAERLARGRASRGMTEKHYSDDLMVTRLAQLYRAAAFQDNRVEELACS